MFFTTEEAAAAAEQIGKAMRGEIPRVLCPLCERHQRMETVDGLQFWIELAEDRKPLFCSDKGQRNGVHVIAIGYCPICGRSLGIQEEEK